MAKKTKKNIAKGKNKKKRQQRQAELQAQNATLDATSAAQDQKALEKAEKEKAKAIEQKKKERERKNNPTFWDKTVNFVKGTYKELKKTQWLDASELNKATGSVFGIVSIFTLVTWLVDSGLGAVTAFILGL